MSHKRWKLVVTELGNATALHEAVVEAGDWMTALTRARAQIGERGGVPPGASCQIASDGAATVTDAVARRRYTVKPTTESNAPAAQVAMPAAPVAAPAPAPPVVVPVPAAAKAPATKKQKQQTMAYLPAQHGALVPPPSPISVGAPAAKAPEPVAAVSRTVSYSTEEVRAAAQAVAQQSAPAGVAPIASAPAPLRPAPVPPPAAVVPPPASAPAAKPKKVAKQTMAYLPAEVIKAAEQAMAAAQAPAAPAPVAPPAPVATPASAPIDAVSAAAVPIEALAGEALAGSPSDTIRTPALVIDDGLELLHARDAEPSKDSPLVYRERHYLLPAGTDADAAEMLLRRRFAALREELATRPKGKLVKMAVFDHRWSGQPTRAPVLALQWKDWRGEAEITSPTPAAPAPSAAAPPPAPLPPAPPPPPAASQPTPAAANGVVVASAHAMPSIVIDPALSAPPPQRPAPMAPVAPAAPSRPSGLPLAATGSSKRNRKLTPGAALTDDRLADAFEGLQDLFFLTTAFEGVEFTLRLTGDLIKSEAMSVALYDINSHEMRFVSTTGPGAEERKGDAVPTTAGLIGAALEHWNKCLVLTNVSADPRFDPGIDGRVGLDSRNMLLMPVATQERLLAIMQLTNRVDDPHFTEADANLVAYIASRLAEFLIQTKMAADRPAKTNKTAPR